ncbi:hypothetical protein GCM10027413_20280 [Conyzicola nivalis]|uniref:Uncharacterized protein n=1 Tax=Conyzicola nivalis TaxID=1477021 RepID=A0A916WG82_9MICO|nr:hypothetical protein [Conyzicola nivalis]GGA94579.1 hypothetical protein GCM10010979_06340 [Conyzicola nivalis]
MTRKKNGGDERVRRQTAMNPFIGKPGFFNRLNRIVFTFAGPAQIGIGKPEAPYRAPSDPVCPMCGMPMALHTIDRSGPRTQVDCPR